MEKVNKTIDCICDWIQDELEKEQPAADLHKTIASLALLVKTREAIIRQTVGGL